MDINVTVLARFQKDNRVTYTWLTLLLMIFIAGVPFAENGASYAVAIGTVLVMIWLYHWITGRRIRTRAFGATGSFWSTLEIADLRRWLEKSGGLAVPETRVSK